MRRLDPGLGVVAELPEQIGTDAGHRPGAEQQG